MMLVRLGLDELHDAIHHLADGHGLAPRLTRANELTNAGHHFGCMLSLQQRVLEGTDHARYAGIARGTQPADRAPHVVGDRSKRLVELMSEDGGQLSYRHPAR